MNNPLRFLLIAFIHQYVAFETDSCNHHTFNTTVRYDRYFALPQLESGSSDEWIGATLGKLSGGACVLALEIHFIHVFCTMRDRVLGKVFLYTERERERERERVSGKVFLTLRCCEFAGGAQDIRSKGVISNVTAAEATKTMQALQSSLPLAQALQTDVVAFGALVPQRRLQFYRQHMAWQTACQHFGYVAPFPFVNII